MYRTTAGPVTVPAPEVAAARIPWGFAEVFVISQTALPALLYLPGSQSFRLPIRVSAFLISLVAFGYYQITLADPIPRSRMQPWVAAVMALLAVMLFHPETASFSGGAAHMAMYFAVMAPLFWAPEFVKSPEHLARLLWILLLCSGVNAAVGVLQAYDPARWLPQEFSRLLTESENGLGAVTFTGPNGVKMVRPPGLFDTPGAVAGPGMFAALLGIVFAASSAAMWKRALSLILAGCGLAAIYLSLVRISLVLTVVMFGVFCMVLVIQGRLARATQFLTIAGTLIAISFTLAVAVGGSAVQERVLTLFATDPLSVYEHARGTQMNLTFNDLLFQYPLGAGLGRWGMAAGYFGSAAGAASGIWAEIQFTGWMIDGGVLMIVLYVGALVSVGRSQLRLSRLTEHPRVAACAAVVFAAGVGTAALSISFTPFVTQVGIQYWFLAGALHGVACGQRLQDAA